jgi:hypothetical protein
MHEGAESGIGSGHGNPTTQKLPLNSISNLRSEPFPGGGLTPLVGVKLELHRGVCWITRLTAGFAMRVSAPS